MLEKLKNTIQMLGNDILKYRAELIEGGVWEGDQLKTKADEFAHIYLENKLIEISDIPVISEESHVSQTDKRPENYWLVDPIDGTRSLVDGFPGWVSQVAYIKNNESQFAVVFAPELQLLFYAEKNQGAYCNDERLLLDKDGVDALTLIDNYPEPRGIAATFFNGLPCDSYVESGSIGLKICRVADATADIFIKNITVRDWDIAAPVLILKEAGGCLTTYSGNDFNLSGDYEKKGVIAVKNKVVQKQCFSFLQNGEFK